MASDSEPILAVWGGWGPGAKPLIGGLGSTSRRDFFNYSLNLCILVHSNS